MIDQTVQLTATQKRVLTALLPTGNEYRRAKGEAGILYNYRRNLDDPHGKNRATYPTLEHLTQIGALKKIGLVRIVVYKITEYGKSLVPALQDVGYTNSMLNAIASGATDSELKEATRQALAAGAANSMIAGLERLIEKAENEGLIPGGVAPMDLTPYD